MASKSIALVSVKDYAVLQYNPQALQEIVRENIGDRGIGTFDIDRIKVAPGGIGQFIVPSLEGDKTENIVDGVVIAWRDPRAYWHVAFDQSGGGSPPDCRADDGYNGVGTPGGDCSKCPFAAFGSAQRNGKEAPGQACKQMRFMFIMRKDSLLPTLIVAPPTSIAPVRKYFLRLASNAVPYYGVATRFKLIKAKSVDGIQYSQIECEMLERLDPEISERMKKLGDMLRPTLDATAIQEQDTRSQ